MAKSRLISLTEKKFDVVISGGGPSALFDAWEALKSGKSVLVVSERKIKFKRLQRVSLYPENKNYLLDMLKDENGQFRRFDLSNKKDKKDVKFVLELIHSASISVRDVERFVKRRCNEFDKIKYAENYQLKSINMETPSNKSGILTIEPTQKHPEEKKPEEKQIEFDCIVCADGGKHHAVNVLNKGFNNPPITYSPLSKPDHPTHASAYITLSRKDGEDLELPTKQVIASSADQTWMLTLDRFSETATKKHINCFFNGEVPEILYNCINIRNDNLNNELIRKVNEIVVANYVCQVIEDHLHKLNLNKGAKLQVEVVMTDDIEEDKLRLQGYTVKPELASRATVEVNGKSGIATGDCRRGANYQFGFGLNNAIDHARKLRDVFSKKKPVAQYDTESECRSFFPPFEFMTKVTNIPLFRGFFGAGIERAIEDKHNEFLKKYAEPIAKLRQQPALQEMEREMNLSDITARPPQVALYQEQRHQSLFLGG